jgi:hypothetical protein
MLLLLGLVGCGGEDRTPDGAVRFFLRTLEEGNPAAIYRLLGPAAQGELQRMAQLANAQVGGLHRFKPGDLIAAGQEPARHDVREVRLLKIEGERAQVLLLSSKKDTSEVIHLVRVNGQWRVEMSLARTPVTEPSSQPAASRPLAPTSAPASKSPLAPTP